jgi:protein-tyrosine kinase
MSRIHEALKKAEDERILREPSELQLNSPVTSHPSDMTSSVLEVDGASIEPPNGTPQIVAAENVLAKLAQQHWTPDSQQLLKFDENGSRSLGTEEFRTLRSRLYQIRSKMPLKVILITSSLPKEGKSFLAANLALVIAQQQGQQVLLIDADLRSSRLHKALGASSCPGMTDYLMGNTQESSIVQRGSLEGVFFIPAGHIVPNPLELLANGRLKTLVDRLAPMFDWIIVDSPPAVPVSDASVLAEICDGVLFVVQTASTPFDIAQRAREEFRQKPILGVVLNRASAVTTITYKRS